MVQAETRLGGGFFEKNTIGILNNRLTTLSNQPGQDATTEISAIQQILSHIDNISTANVQGFLVNDFGYQPLGNWQASQLADVSLFLKNNFFRNHRYSLSMEYGLDLPTAYIDDPNILTDFSFGHGTWAPYFVFAQDYYIRPSLSLFSSLNGQYFFEQKQWFRFGNPEEETFSENLAEFSMTRGPMLGGEFGGAYRLSQNWSIEQSIAYRSYGRTKVDNRVLEFTSLPFQFFRTLTRLTINTVESYLQKKFFIPFEISLAYEDVFGGNNASDIETYYVELRLFF